MLAIRSIALAIFGGNCSTPGNEYRRKYSEDAGKAGHTGHAGESENAGNAEESDWSNWVDEDDWR
jgi:hypothetical protein